MQTIFTTVVLMLNVAQAEPPDFDIGTKKKEDSSLDRRVGCA